MSKVKATLNLKSGDNSGQTSRIELREESVVGLVDRGMMGRAETSIPLRAVDAVFTGWYRHLILLLLGIGAILLGLLGKLSEDYGGVGVLLLVCGIVLIIVFWVFRPAAIKIYSGSQILDGIPVSIPAGEEFAQSVIEAVNAHATVQSNTSSSDEAGEPWDLLD